MQLHIFIHIFGTFLKLSHIFLDKHIALILKAFKPLEAGRDIFLELQSIKTCNFVFFKGKGF